jgi:PST family polysaccharide transporter
MVSAMMLSRLLAPHDFGLVAMATAITGFLSLFADPGLAMATIQRDDITHAQVSALFWVNIGVSAFFLAATVAIAPVLARFYGEPRLFWIAIVTGLAFPLGGLAVQHKALLLRQMRFTLLAAIDTAALTVGVALAVVTAWSGGGYWALVYLSLGMSLTTLVGVWIACPWRPGPPYWKNTGGLLRFGGHLTVVEFLMYLGSNIDNVLIGRFYGPGPLGQYSRAYSLLLLPLQLIASPLASVALPALSRLRHEPARFRKALLSMQQVIALTMIPLAAFMIGSADWIIRIVLGSQWEDAAQLFAILGIAALTESLGNAGYCLLTVQGRTDRLLQWGILATFATVLAIVLGLPWGPRGVAIGYTVASLLVRTPLMFWSAGTVSSVRTGDFYRVMTPFLLAAIIELAGLVWFRWQVATKDPVWGLVGALAVALPTYLGVLWMFPSGRQALLDLRDNLALLRGPAARFSPRVSPETT